MDAEERRRLLIDDIESISSQLGNRNRKHEAGDRLSPVEYWAWRNKAVAALYHKHAALRRLKSWIRSWHDAAKLGGDTPLPNSAESLLKSAFALFCELSKANVTFTEDEKRLLGQVEAFLESQPVSSDAKDA